MHNLKLGGVMRRAAFLLFPLVAVFCVQAGTISLPAARVTQVLVTGPCAPGNWSACGSKGDISSSTANWETTFFNPAGFNGTDPTTQTFKSAFNTWNAANGNLWTLVNGGALDVTYKVTKADAFADQSNGGYEINVALENYVQAVGGPTLNQLIWSQGLYINYDVAANASLNPPKNLLDTYSFSAGSGGEFNNPCEALPTPGPSNTNPSNIGATPANKAYCDPIYPFQYADKHFYDKPTGIYPSDSFRGIALLSTVTFETNAGGAITKRTLTVYDGVSYGYDLFVVPEPQTFILVGAGFALFALRRRIGSAA